MNVLRLSSAVAACVCAALLYLVPASVQASEKTGVYVTPKVTANFMTWQARGDANAASTTYVSSNPQSPGAGAWDFTSGRQNTLWGGALALGYDFYPRFDLPLRVELEYGIYSNAQGSNDYALSPAQIKQVLPNGNNSQRKACMDMDLKLRNIQTLLLNAYWDFHNSTAFTPYIGAGVGLAFIQAQGSATIAIESGNYKSFYDKGLGARDYTNFAWQVGAGCSYAFSDTIALDLGYRFMGLGNVESNSISVTDINHDSGWNCVMPMHGKAEAQNIYMHQVALGLRISF